MKKKGKPIQWFQQVRLRSSETMAESLSLELFKKCVDVALRDMAGGHGGDGLMVGLDITALFQR